ncbi:MAG: hypothetical protein V2I33_23130, partial [Kangiellaceae bacterium]|nr:hypothetical protein [Kangiellaceae bacterium]
MARPQHPSDTADRPKSRDSSLAALSELVASCLPQLGGTQFADELISGLRRLVTIDDATVIYYAGGDLPRVVYRESPQARGSES